MSVDQVTLFLALLAVAAATLTVAIALAAVATFRSSRWADRWGDLRAEVGVATLLVAAIVGLVATAGSLYLSEVANFPPCRLCWYQRIAAYPLGPMLALAWWRRDVGVRPYALLLAGVGAAISLYHVLLERFPDLETGACEIDNPCSIRWVERFGFLTIPTMALIAFATIGALVLVAPREVDR